MAKLDKEQRKARKDARFRERVEQRRANGSDVVAYALINSRAYRFLTDSEREELRVRRAERKARRDARLAAERRLHHEVVRCWKDFGAGHPPGEMSLQDDRCWDAAARRLRAWGDDEAADLWRDTGSHTPDDAHPRMMQRILEVADGRMPARGARPRG
ncbi:MAG: hypothetical protein F4213_10320 [Boseongicola sp. SB0677_bin_26]|nr:hypothetical protein [Boseongicola sp. SB0665_bin_10]MYG26403.1 hypothetical protein [Boseongicola sp. SB0677_bin_26]